MRESIGELALRSPGPAMSGEEIRIQADKELDAPLGLKVNTSETFPTQCLVVGVSPSSTAEVAGVKPNDLILTIDEQEIRLLSKQEVEAKLEQVATMTRICMTLKRPQAAPIANTIEKESTAGAKEGPLTVASPAPKATPSPSPLRAQPAVSVMNYITGEKRTDTLMMSRTSVFNQTGCTERRCIGSQMFPKRRNLKVPYSKAEKKELAKDFLKQYYQFLKSENSPEHNGRVATVMTEIDRRGTYDLTFKELSFGCRMAWRNAPRCMNRIQWRKLHVFDQRDVQTEEEMFAAMVHHIRFCSNPENPGVLKSTITVFPEAVDADHEYRVWNTQFIRYAGYKMPDGSILGDPANVDFTEVCIELGWNPPKEKSQCDVLPLVLQANGGDPRVFELEKEDILEVPLTHPQYPGFDELKLKWYAVPGVSCLMLEIGGLRFTAAPFNGWYLVTEIGARDLGDPMRYNMLEKMAHIMKLDVRRDQLWKDKALVELNAAVLHSYNKHGVSILDHHTGSENFMKFMEQEYRERGGCPADWVWIVPPLSGSATPVYHQEMLVYHLSPSFEYQDDPWIKWRQAKQSDSKVQGKNRFQKIARSTGRLNLMLQMQMKKRRHCTILYATETGHSETYARLLQKLFSHAFKCDLYCMDSYLMSKLEEEDLVLVVTSTFGSGEPPSNGEEFAQKLISMQAPEFPVKQRRISVVMGSSWKPEKDVTPLSSMKFAVFGLGSRAYPDTFCAFAHTIDKLFGDLGGERIFSVGEGDELCGQAETFRHWAMKCYETACKYYGLDLNLQHADSPLMGPKWGKNKFRLRKVEPNPHNQLLKADHFQHLHNCPKLMSARLVERLELQAQSSLRSTKKLVLDVQGRPEQFKPGDHLSVFPENNPNLVDELLDCVDLTSLSPDDPVILEFNKGREGSDEWQQLEEQRFCQDVTMRDALTKYLDITTPPTPELLKLLALQATSPEDCVGLQRLAKGEREYEEWKYKHYPNLLEVILSFPSLRGSVDAAFLLSQLPLLQARYYSISSSPNLYPGQVHITVAVVDYQVKPFVRQKQQSEGLSQEKKTRRHLGVCSNWLSRIELGTTVPCYFRKAANFHMPSDPAAPIIMVGPGTGIAPFRSFWQERIHHLNCKPGCLDQNGTAEHNAMQSPALNGCMMTSSGLNEDHVLPETTAAAFGPMYLFFGCRQSTVDQIYSDEAMNARQRGAIDEYYVALSREPGKPKTYVQHSLQENADMLVKLLDAAHVYVCGDTSMARDVLYTVVNILITHCAMSQQEARRYVDTMKEGGRYHEDIFGVTFRTAEVTDRFRNAATRKWNASQQNLFLDSN